MDLTQAKVTVAVEADLFGSGDPLAIKYAREFAAGRQLHGANGEMNRLYVVESVPTVTGSCTDHRRALRPGAVRDFLRQLAHALGLANPGLAKIESGIDEAFVEQLKADLEASRGRCVIVPGKRLDATTCDLIAEINAVLGNSGRTEVYYHDPDRHPLLAPFEDTGCIEGVAKYIDHGLITTLLILGGNPVYNAPADLRFGDALKKVKNTVHLAIHDDETSRLCDWHLSRATPPGKLG